MSTSLAAQLAARAQSSATHTQTTAALKRPPSFIYTPRHAASVSLADLHALADNAWEQLAAIDPFFAAHYREVLGEQAKTLDRTGLTKEENEKVGRMVDKVLRALGKHILLKPAGIVLEWMVRKFRVQDLNVPALLALFLPYHTTPHFASALNLISEPTLSSSDVFASLLPVKKTLSPPPLAELIALLPPFSPSASARPLLDFLLRLPLSYLEADQTPHRALTAFWLQTLAGYLDRAGARLPEGEQAAVLSTILEVLRSARSAPDTLLASYILVARFAMHHPFDAETLRVVLKGVVSNRARSHVADEETDAALVTTLVVISQLGEEEVKVGEGKKFLGNAGWKSLLKTSKLDDLVVQLSNQYDAQRFMRPFLQTLAEEARVSEECLTLLVSLLVPRPSPSLDSTSTALLTLPTPLISHLLSVSFTAVATSESDSSASPSALLKPLSQVYQRYPALWTAESAAITARLKESEDEAGLQRVLRAMNAVLLGGADVASSSSSSSAAGANVLSAEAPDVALRVSALKDVLSSASALEAAGNKSFLRDTLLARLAEAEPTIAEVLFSPSSVPTLLATLSVDEVLDAAEPALAAAKGTKTEKEYLELLLPFLAGPFASQHPAHADETLKAVFLPRLLGTSSGGAPAVAATLAVHAALRGSELEKQHAWLAGFSAVGPPQKDADVTPEANDRIVELLARNIASLASDEVAKAEGFLLSRLSSPAADTLTPLLALRLSGKLSSTRRVSFAQRVLAALSAVELDRFTPADGKAEALLSDSSTALSSQLSQAAFARPAAPETRRKLRAALLVGVVRAVAPAEKAAWSWLALREEEGQEYRAFCGAVYRLAHAHSGSPASEALATQLLETLFSALVTEDAVAFLASLYTSTSSSSIDLRLAALRDTAVFVSVLSTATAQPKGKLVDWQVVVPSLIVALSSEEKRVRVEALRTLQAIRTALGDGKGKTGAVYGQGKFYGARAGKGASEVQYLGLEDVVAYLDKLLASSTELTLSGSHLAVLHASLLDAPSASSTPSSKKRKSSSAALSFKVATFLTSHIQAWTSLPARVELLKALEGVKDKDKHAALVGLLAASISAPASATEQVDVDLAASYARLLLQPFDGAARKWLEAPTETGEAPITVLVKAVEQLELTGLKAHFRKEALRVVSRTVFAAVKGETRTELWRRLVKIAVVAESRVNTDVLATLRAVKVDTETLTTFINEIRTSIAPPAAGKGAKRGRTSLAASSASSTAGRTERIPELVVLLESVEFADVPASHGLLLGLFDMLATLVDLPTAAGQTDVSYPGQLLLGALARVVENVKPESGVTSDSIRMAPVLDFMRSSINPQTYHQSLLLLAQLGPLVPDQLVHNVMPIFTFMGANVLQRDDAYSLRVVDQTLDNIVPALVKAMQKSAHGRNGLLNELKDLLRAFTDAAAHVPRHRRINLFVRLVETLGAKEFLSAVAMLLVDKAGKIDESALPLALTEHFGVEVQLAALKQVVEEVARLVNLEPSFLQSIPDETVTTGKAKEQSLSLLTFLGYALESKQLLSKVDSARTAGSEDIETDLTELVRGLLDLTSATSPSFTSEERAALASASDYAVNAAVALMSTKSFADALLWLLELADPAIQPRAFALLRNRLPHVKPTRRGDLTPAIVAVVENALAVLGGDEEAQGAAAVEGALDTLAVIADSVLAAEDTALAKTVPQLVEVAKDGEQSKAVRVAALDVVRRLTARLGPRLIPLVAKLVPFALELLSEQAKAGADAVVDLVTGAYATLEGLFSSVPTFIGGQLDKVFSASLSPAVMALSDVKGSAPSKARAALLSTAAKKLPAKTLYPAIVKLHASLDNKQREPLLGLLDVLTRALRHGKTADIADNYKAIFKLFLTVFDLRRTHPAELDREDVAGVEDHALGAFTQFILKLNEQIFRPLFLRAYDWAVIDLAESEDGGATNEGLTARRTVLYKLVDRLLGQLKSIFVPYFSFMLDQTVELLEAYAKKEQRGADLWAAVASSLTKALEFDESAFWTPGRLGKLSSPLARQIEVSQDVAVPAAYHSLLSAFADAVASNETQLKALNSSFLHLTRSDDLRVKRSAIEALEQMWETVGDGMLGLVPETTPFLAEAREETEGGVEAATRRLIKTIEAHLGEGESLEEYLA